MSESYRLIYWPGLPGRGEYVRMVLAEAGVAYDDVATSGREAAIPVVMSALQGELGGVPPLAPPILLVGDLALSQTASICEFLAIRHGMIDADEGRRALARQLQLSIADLADEAHNTHHPIATGKYYEDQKVEALLAAEGFRDERLPKFLGYFERVLASSGGEYLLGDFTYPDLGLFHTVVGLEHAFPRAMARVLTELPLLVAHRDRVATRPRIAAYLASEKRQAFTEHGIFRHYPELDG